MVNIAVRMGGITFVFFYFLWLPIIINSQTDETELMKCYTGHINYPLNPPAGYIKETFNEEECPAYSLGCVRITIRR